MSDVPEYVLDRVFNAPRELVWKAWTDPELVAQWYGPNIETIIHGYDLKVGGAWLNEMKMGDKSDLSKMVFQEIVTEEKLVWLHSSVDENWDVAANQMMPDWPRTLLTTVTFTDEGGGTKVRLSQVPVDAAENEIAFFAKMMADMDGGWGGGYKNYRYAACGYAGIIFDNPIDLRCSGYSLDQNQFSSETCARPVKFWR